MAAALSKNPFNMNVRNSGLDVIRDTAFMRQRDDVGRKLAVEVKKENAAVVREIRSDWPFVPPMHQGVRDPSTLTGALAPIDPGLVNGPTGDTQ